MPNSEQNGEPPTPLDRTAVAIYYDPANQAAPTVLASGKGEIAATIIRIAKENNVPLQSDPVLATALAGLDLGSQIPPELYRAVAEVLAFIYKLSNTDKLPKPVQAAPAAANRKPAHRP